ncbi:hypothetical protein TSUD_119150 [Trifolium subterraneum]|uniref:Annexin n=1 Tax=Trifolium subterraneum TaxID=3900 RepID=A0A2Z6NRE3_TRISU|nr:hypothetical protein TSUD_119150 [Trifolium subterraneum]
MATLIAPSNHSPIEDAQALQHAFKGWGADNKAIVAILGHRNVHQRQQIRKAYEELFEEDLIKRLESEISAIRNGSKNYHVVAEIASVLSAEELLAVRRAYHNRYKRSIEEDVSANTTGHLRQAKTKSTRTNITGTKAKITKTKNVSYVLSTKTIKLLVGLVSSFRYEGDEINAKLAQTEANVIHESVKEKKGNNEEEVIRILTTRSKTQLVLRNAIKKFGTDEDGITRVIVTRAEKDLRDIKELYYKRNSVHLEDAVSKEISGDYKKFILTLLGKQD